MPKRIPESRRLKVITLYERGLSPYQIEDQMRGKVSSGSVRLILQEAGIPLRGRSEAKRRKDLPPVEILKQHYEEERRSLYWIGEKYGINPSTIRFRLKEAGVEIRGLDEAKQMQKEGWGEDGTD